MAQDLVQRPAVEVVETASEAPRDRAENERHRRRPAHDRELRDVVIAVGLMGLTGALFWITAGGLLVLFGSPGIEP